MRTIGVSLALLLSSSLFASCSSQKEPEAPVGVSRDLATQEEDASGDVGVGGAASASAKSKTEPAESKPEEPEEPAHCPPEMVYVEGQYCTHESNDAEPDEHGNTPGAGAKDIDVIERKCLEHWYAPQNDKKVCEKFEKEGKCTGKFVPKRYCIDRYAWPNVEGHKPEVMNRFYQAQVKCAAAGKRLCTESEWTFACEGPDMKPFPYGYVRDADKCHGDEPWDSPNMTKVAQRDREELRRLYKGVPSGQEQCVSDFGVYDLPANTDEVVASETFESGWRGKYESVHTGGPWYKGVRNQCRPKIYTHDEGFYYYFLSFRCCAAPDGAPTDPRTPKQRAEGKSMETIERIAGITVEEMRAMLEKKKTDPTCGCKTTRCRTFCGTLHGDPGTGPDAWNPPLGERAGNGMPDTSEARPPGSDGAEAKPQAPKGTD